jgi:ferrous iron transport protein A
LDPAKSIKSLENFVKTQTMPLSAAPEGQRLRILSLPNHPALEQRLHSMGIKPGSEVQVLRRGFPGGILHVACGMLEFMLRQDQAKELMVALIAGPQAND